MSGYREIVEFYDAEYAHLRMLGRDVEFFLAHLGDEPAEVLEIGCGTGRAAALIAQHGHRVTGLDVDEQILALAARKRDAAGLDETQLRLVHADAGDPEWPRGLGRRKFDVVCCFFNTFLALSRPEQQEAALRAARSVLRPGGRVWLDVFNPNLELIVGSIGGVDELEPTLFHLPDGRSVQRLTSLRADVSAQIQHVTFHYEWFDAKGKRRRKRRSFELAWITPRELERLLRLCGFELEEAWGDHNGAPVSDDAPRQIISAVRA